MNRVIYLFIVLVVLFADPVFSREKHQFRHLQRMEFIVPLGEHQLGSLFMSLAALNQKGLSAFPRIRDSRLVTLRPGDRRRAYIISGSELMSSLKRQVKLFERDYEMEVTRNSFRIVRSDGSGGQVGSLDTSRWMRKLSRIEGDISVGKGQSDELKSGIYQREVDIQGRAELKDGNAVFRDLKVDGSLEITGKKVKGETLKGGGEVKMSGSSEAEFKKVEATGDIKVEDGSTIKAKNFHFKKNGRIILGEGSEIILD